jgi:maleylacetoacetate isomerase
VSGAAARAAPELVLHSYFRSSAAYRVRIALAWKGLPYAYTPVHLLRGGGEQRHPAYLAAQPQGLVPLLEHGGAQLAQSLAIIEYLEESFPHTRRLLPVPPAARAQVRALAQAVACDIHPLNNLRVLQYLQRELGQEQPAVRAWYRHWVAEGFGALERWIAQYSGDGEHCFGSEVTLADVCLVPQLYNARRFEVDLAPYPALVRAADALDALPEFAAARPERQPDAE